jgi:hypothetical protein
MSQVIMEMHDHYVTRMTDWLTNLLPT